MASMFQECKELKYLDLSKFNTENVTDMKNMFYRCIKLKEIKGLNNFITYKVISMNSMFQGCKELEKLDLSNLNISNVNNMESMFSGCSKLYEIKGIKKFLYNKVTDINMMFQSCTSLQLNKYKENKETKQNETNKLTNIDFISQLLYKLDKKENSFPKDEKSILLN